MHTELLSDPAAFDRFVYESAPASAFPDTPLGTARAAYAAFLRGDNADQIAALKSLADANAAPAPGVCLMLRVLLGEEAQVARAELAPAGGQLLDWENTCHTASAIGIARAMTGELDRAQMHLMVARTLAQGLGLINRAQMLTLEWGRIASLRGHPEPDAIAAQLLTPMPQRRRNWGQRTLAEALMGLGSHQQALWTLGTPENDTPADAALRDYLHAVLRLPAVDGVCPDLDYVRLATCVRGTGNGRRMNLSGIQGQPQAGYAAVAEGMAFASTSTLAQQTVRLLARQTFAPADLSVYRAVALLSAVANGAQLQGQNHAGRGQPLTGQLVEAVSRLRAPEEVMAHLLNISPASFALLAFSPVAAQVPGLGLASLALLAGKHVLCGATQMVLPGRWGTVMVFKALDLFHDEVARAEKARFKRAVSDCAAPLVNLGWVVRACMRLSASAQRQGHTDEAAGWHDSAQTVTRLLSCDVQAELRRSPINVV